MPYLTSLQALYACHSHIQWAPTFRRSCSYRLSRNHEASLTDFHFLHQGILRKPRIIEIRRFLPTSQPRQRSPILDGFFTRSFESSRQTPRGHDPKGQHLPFGCVSNDLGNANVTALSRKHWYNVSSPLASHWGILLESAGLYALPKTHRLSSVPDSRLMLTPLSTDSRWLVVYFSSCVVFARS